MMESNWGAMTTNTFFVSSYLQQKVTRKAPFSLAENSALQKTKRKPLTKFVKLNFSGPKHERINLVKEQVLLVLNQCVGV